jgi:predicted nucleic acid-binding protein
MTENKAILVDSCIINNLASKQKDLAQQTFELIKQLTNSKNSLFISEFSYYELLRTSSQSTKTKTLNFIEQYTIVPQSKERLERAALLYTAYKNHNPAKNILHSISDIDIFIGSLIFTKHQPLLLTSDYYDFPRPFFMEKMLKRIEYKRKGKVPKNIYYYFFKADLKTVFGNF